MYEELNRHIPRAKSKEWQLLTLSQFREEFRKHLTPNGDVLDSKKVEMLRKLFGTSSSEIGSSEHIIQFVLDREDLIRLKQGAETAKGRSWSEKIMYLREEFPDKVSQDILVRRQAE